MLATRKTMRHAPAPHKPAPRSLSALLSSTRPRDGTGRAAADEIFAKDRARRDADSARLVKDPVRYKTVMCENWTKHGTCPYDFKCQFAHGAHELRERKAKDSKPKTAPPTTKASSAMRRNKVGFHVEELLTARKSDPNDITPPCSPCSSGRETPPLCAPCSDEADEPPSLVVLEPGPPPAIVLEPPPGLSAPPGLAPPPGLSVAAPPAPLAVPKPTAATFCQIDFAPQGGAAGCFSAPTATAAFVPQGVAALWGEAADAREVSPLRCNRKTGKVEPSMPPVPWVVRKMSSAGDLVRRAVSFVLEEPSEPSVRRESSRSTRRGSRAGLSSARPWRRSERDEAPPAVLDAMSASTKEEADEPYPEWA